MSPPTTAGDSGRDAARMLNLPSISTVRSGTPSTPRESPSPIVSTPTQSLSPFAHAASMKKRLSDTITDSWSRRRPSIQQSAGTGTMPATLSRSKDSSTSISSSYGSSKSRSRSSSAATPTIGVPAAAHSPGYPPLRLPALNTSASSATLASTRSASSSIYSSPSELPRQDSYTDSIGRGYTGPRPPTSSPTSAAESYTVESPTIYEPVRHIASRSIAQSLRDVEEGTEDFHNSSWEDLGLRGINPPKGPPSSSQGIRTTGLVRRISDSKRIMASEPVTEDHLDDASNAMRVMRHRKIYTSEHALLGIPQSAIKRESSSSTIGGSSARVYDHSSDDESTASSIMSVGGASVGSSSRQGLPHTVSYGTNKRFSRNAYHPPFEYSPDKTSDNGASPSLSRPQSSAGVPVSRALTASPLKHGSATVSSMSLRSISSSLDPSQRQDSGSRLSSLTSKTMTPTPYQQSTAGGRSASGALTRSDSQTSMSSTANTARTSGTSSTATGPTSQAHNSHRTKLMAARNRRNTALAASIAAATSPTGITRGRMGPPLPDPATAPKVEPAPASGMYWYKAPVHGIEHKAARAHASTLVGNNIYVFGGADLNTCFNDLYVFDAGMNELPIFILLLCGD